MDSSVLETDTRVRVTSRKHIIGDIYEIRLEPPEKLEFQPGQYIRLTIPELERPDPRGNSRDFSLTSSPLEDSLVVVTRATGSGFKQVLIDEATETIGLSGPFGVFTLPPDTGRPVVLIAAGIGITPFLSMVRYVTAQELPHKLSLLYCYSPLQAAYLDELTELSASHNFFSFTHRPGRLTWDALKPLAREDSLFYVAGPPLMVAEANWLLRQLGVHSDQIRIEEFTGYPETATSVRGGSRTSAPGDQTRRERLGERMEGDLAERSLPDIEALLQALSATALVSETNAEGTITFANDKFVEVSKYSREELIGQNHRILKSGLHPEAFFANLWATISRGRLWRGLIKNKAKDGSYYWVDTSIVPILNDSGKPVKYISVRIPVTEHRKAEEELQERVKQQNMLTVLSQEALANSDLTALFDKASTLLTNTLNVPYCAIERLAPDGHSLILESGLGWESKGTSIPAGLESMSGYTLTARKAVIVEDLSTESRFTGSSLLYDNSVVSGLSVIIQGQEDRPFGVLAAYTCSKRQFSPEDIGFVQAIASLLANAVRNHLDQRKDEFLGIASHELKTPLTSIKTFTQLLQRHADSQQDEKGTMYLGKITVQLSRLTSLVSDLLDISRINVGKIEYNDEEFSLIDLARSVVADTQLSCQHKLELHGHCERSVRGDKDRIEQVLHNLLANAIKYSPEADRVLVRIVEERSRVVVSVQDFGAGIPKTEQAHIFERFYQGQRRQDYPGGLGLGLYISAQIIKRHMGQLWVESEEGNGAEFCFSLPLVQGNA